MTNVPPPKTGFVETLTRIAWSGEIRWVGEHGRIYTWDRLHGEFEVFNRRGRHLGSLDVDGIKVKDAVKGRSIDV